MPLLDETHRWDRELSQDEQLCLVFARILLQNPPWVLIDGTFGSLDDDVLELVMDVFTKELAQTGVIHIGGPGEAHSLFSTVAAPGQGAARRSHGADVEGAGAMRRVFCRLAALLLAVLGPEWAIAQSLEFQAPAAANDPATPRIMRDLAERLLPVYQEPDQDRYLANLSALQMVAGDYVAADATRESLRERRRSVDSGRPVGRGTMYDVYAHAKSLETEDHLAFNDAFREDLRGGHFALERP